MKLVKKVATILTICMFFLTATACADNSWAIKGEEETLSTGVYVFYLMQSYQEAMQKLTQEGKSTSDISNEKIEDQSAPNWIVEKALKRCKELIATEKMFKDMNLSLTEEESKKAQETTDSLWESSGSMYEKNFGINKDAVHQASSLFNSKIDKIFHAIYGKEGSNAVSDDEINDYYKTNYVKILFYSKVPYEATENNEEKNNSESENKTETETSNEGENKENSEENKKVATDETIQKEFEEYISAINSGSQTVDQIRDAIKKSENITDDTDPLVEQIINPNSSSLTEEIRDAVSKLDAGKATYIKFNDVYFMLIKSNSPVENPDLSEEGKRDGILYDMKNKEFENKIEESVKGINFNINYNAVNQFNPLMFSKLVTA